MQLGAAYNPGAADRIYEQVQSLFETDPSALPAMCAAIQARESAFFSIMQQLFLETTTAGAAGVSFVLALAKGGTKEVRNFLLRSKLASTLVQTTAPVADAASAILECLATPEDVVLFLTAPASDSIKVLRSVMVTRTSLASRQACISLVAQLLARCPAAAPQLLVDKKVDAAFLKMCSKVVENGGDPGSIPSLVYSLRVLLRLHPNDQAFLQPCFTIAARLAASAPAEACTLAEDVAAATTDFIFAAAENTAAACL